MKCWRVALAWSGVLAVVGPAYGTLSEAAKGQIDLITGAKGVYTSAEDVDKVSFPRTDVKVTVDRWPMQPFMGLTSWAAFTSGHQKEAMVMGDLVLFEDEVNPVMSAALDNHLEVTALHNHFFFDSPRVMFMHIGGEGKAEDLARGVRRCLDKVKEIRASSAVPASQFPGDIPANSKITGDLIEHVFGTKGQASNGMFKITIGRRAIMHGQEIGNQMGVNTWAAFAGTDDNAFVDGDYAMHTSELQGVLKALRGAGVNVVAIHNHMAQEEPQYVFLHYWGKGTVTKLTRGLKSALDTQNLSSSMHTSHPFH